VENASCEFDVKTLKPTYKLLLGIPGKSNAFAISEKLGIDKEIINLADSFITEDDKNIDRITEALEKARQEAEMQQKKAEQMQRLAEQKVNEAEAALKSAEEKRDKILEKAKNDASYIVDNARYKSGQLMSELEDIKKRFSSENAAELYGKAKRNVKNTLDDIEKTSDPVSKLESNNYVLPRELVVGDSVLVYDLNKQATIEQLSKDLKRALVSMGALKTWTDVSNLRLVETKSSKNAQPKTRRVTGVKSRAERDVRYEFDMRGMTVDEGIMELDRYIDGAVLAGIPSVTIIHGKGTGALRKAVHDFLKSNKNIRTYRLGVFGEGEAGVTIAEIKS
jgi:DNA mismatch repair protein MutS2